MLVLVLAWFVALPWLLRNRIEAAMKQIGVQGVQFRVERATPWGSTLSNVGGTETTAVGVQRIAIDYGPDDLMAGKIDVLRLTGGRVELIVQNGKIDFSPLAKFIAQSQSAATKPASPSSAPISIPVTRIELADSVFALKTERGLVEVPVDLTVMNSPASGITFDARIGPRTGANKSMVVQGQLAPGNKSAVFQGFADPGWTLLTVASIWPNVQATADGNLEARGNLQWLNGGLEGTIEVKIASPTAKTASTSQPTNLHLTSGVLLVMPNSSPTTPLEVAVAHLSFSDASRGIAAEEIEGRVLFNRISPLGSLENQKGSVKNLTAGQLALANGKLDFQVVGNDTLNIRETRWNWLGGEVIAQGLRVNATDPIKLDLQLRDVDLKQLLDVFAKGKATGDGKLSGVLPVTITGYKIDFGDARITAISGGSVQIKDSAAILPTAEAAAQTAKTPSAAEQVKHNIIEALGDFVFDRLSMQMTKEEGKTVAYVRMSGQGRSGAKQGLDYELRVNGVDSLLKAYINIQAAMPQAADLQQKAATTRKAQP